MENFSNYYKKNYRSSSSFSSGLYILIIDVLALFLCIGFGFFIVNLFDRSIINFKSFVNYFLFIPFIIIIYALNGLYPGIMMPPTEQLKKISISTFLCFFAISVSLFISNIQDISFSKNISGEDELTLSDIYGEIDENINRMILEKELENYINYYNTKRMKAKLKMSPVQYRTHFNQAA